MNAKTRRWALDTAERCIKTFLEAYFAVWFAMGADFDHLFTVDNLKGGVVGVALSLAMSVGALKQGADDSASFLPGDVDPPQPVKKKAAARKTAAKRKPAPKP